MMRSLFFKILISFIAITLFASISTAFIAQWAQIGPYGELQKDMVRHQFRALTHTLSVTGSAVTTILRNGGPEELVRYFQEVEGRGRNKIFLVKADDSSFSGTQLPPIALNLLAEVRRTGHLSREKSDDEIMVALPLFSKNSNGLILVGLSARGVLGSPSPINSAGKKWFRPGLVGRPLGLPIPIMIGIAAIGCYFLARSLTSPIRDLRRAAQRMASGDFSARVTGVAAGGDEIADLSRDFNTMAERTESLLQAQKRLLRDISHELRSPLTRQNVALELAGQRFPEAAPYLERIAKESQRLDELIGHLLVLTRLEADVDDSTKEPVSLHGLLHAIVRDADFEAVNVKRRVTCTLQDVSVNGSPEMLSRAFENIIRNGVRYTAEETAVEVELVSDGAEATVTVRDHGPGVPEEYVQQIFKPFFRVEKSRDRDSGGTGIGLAIARQAILLHGGSIKAENSRNGGLKVVIRLPVSG